MSSRSSQAAGRRNTPRDAPRCDKGRARADFLKAGGLGILVGDRRLNYATEDLLETHYRFQIIAPVSLTTNYQFVLHPAYNQDRGPVSVFALRLHLQY
jgi:high affinity Mn2+ porin